MLKKCFFFQHDNKAIYEMHIEVMDEHAASKKVWIIDNPAEMEDGWHVGQVPITPLENMESYWVIIYSIHFQIVPAVLPTSYENSQKLRMRQH